MQIKNLRHNLFSVDIGRLISPVGCTAVALGLLGFVAGVAILYATSEWGLVVSSDTVNYLRVARCLADGYGFYYGLPDGSIMPLTHFPPLYPLILSVPYYLDSDPIVVMRWVNALFFGGSCSLMGYIIHMNTRSYAATLLAGALAAVGRPMLSVYTLALTEPLFLSVLLLHFAFLLSYLKSHSRITLFTSGIILGVGCLLRYAGVFFVFASAVIILIEERRNGWKQSFVITTIFCLFALTPFILWTLRCLNLAGRLGNRELVVHFFDKHHIKAFIWTILSWFFSGVRVPGISLSFILFRIVTVSIMFMITIAFCILNLRKFGLRRFLLNPDGKVSRVAFFYAAIYTVFLTITISFIDGAVPIDDRLLSPLYIFGVIGVVVWLTSIVREQRRVLRHMFCITCILFLASQSAGALLSVEEYHLTGGKYTSNSCTTSGIIKFLKLIPQTEIIYATDPDNIFYLTGRPTFRVPMKRGITSKLPNKNYEMELEAMIRHLEASHGVLVLFSVNPDGLYPTIAELKEKFDSNLLASYPDGEVLSINPKKKL
jgi:4-amino-4-deoxy-L-arabinose transferase-like glycosyltransferase